MECRSIAEGSGTGRMVYFSGGREHSFQPGSRFSVVADDPENRSTVGGKRACAAKIYFQWAQHDMYISQKSADEYFNAVGGPKEQKWYFTSHEFNDAKSKSDRTVWLVHALAIK